MITLLRRLFLPFLTAALLIGPGPGMSAGVELPLKSIDIGGGVRLHYVEQGSGPAP